MSGDNFITTRSGQVFYFDSPEKFEYSLSDMGYALGNLCRFVGQAGWWSVAQHSLLVMEFCEPRDKLRGLLHDASEAFLGDMPGPLKHMKGMTEFRRLEKRVMESIHKQFGIPRDVEAERRVKEWDLRAFRAETAILGLKVHSSWESWYVYPIPDWIQQANNGQAGKEFERRAVWLMEQ
jgi:hypothetical protein